MELDDRPWLNEAVNKVFGNDADTVKATLKDLGVDQALGRVEDTVKRRLKELGIPVGPP
jgi:hypothetical protein